MADDPPPSATSRLGRRAAFGLISALALPATTAHAAVDPNGAPAGTLLRVLRTGVLRVGVWLDVPPWGSYGDDGSPDGAEVALAKVLARDLGVRLRLVRLAAHNRIEALEEDRVDVLLALVPAVPATRRRVALASAHGELVVTIAAPRGHRFRTLDDLAGKRIALPEHTYAADAVRGRLPPDTTALFLPDTLSCADAAAHGRADAAALYSWMVRDLTVTRPDLELELAFPVSHTHHAMAVSLGEHDLLRFLNTFLYLRQADGTIADIQERYLRSVSPPLPAYR